MIVRTLAACALFGLAAPVLAMQDKASDAGTPHTPLPADRGYDKPSARTEAIDAPSRPAVAAANLSQAQAAATLYVVNADEQARYAQDMAAYLAKLRAHDARWSANEAHYARQQRAYADAMAVWRRQVADCKRGITAACNAPTPDPANYW